MRHHRRRQLRDHTNTAQALGRQAQVQRAMVSRETFEGSCSVVSASASATRISRSREAARGVQSRMAASPRARRLMPLPIRGCAASLPLALSNPAPTGTGPQELIPLSRAPETSSSPLLLRAAPAWLSPSCWGRDDRSAETNARPSC
jgi:hypothetical protein